MDTVMLNNGVAMPLKGFGTFQITDEALCRESVSAALRAGYRLIDTAACYGNEKAVGESVRASGLDRQEVFLVSKVWIQDAGYESTMQSFQKTLANLQTDYLDLYLIHMPYGDYHGSWQAMSKLLQAKKVRAVGVCNFLPDRLADLILTHGILPAVNQIELHPFCQQKELRRLMAKYKIQPMAWAPFAEGQKNIFHQEVLQEIGKKYDKSAAQVILRWLKQEKIAAIPKSVHVERIAENFAIDDFALSEADRQQIEQLDSKWRILDVASLEEAYRLHGIKFVQRED